YQRAADSAARPDHEDLHGARPARSRITGSAYEVVGVHEDGGPGGYAGPSVSLKSDRTSGLTVAHGVGHRGREGRVAVLQHVGLAARSVERRHRLDGVRAPSLDRTGALAAQLNLLRGGPVAIGVRGRRIGVVQGVP